jgi:hypothetical protein
VSAAVRAVGEAKGEHDGWTFPLPVKHDDQRAELTQAERHALTELGPKALRRNRARGIPRRPATHWKALARLVKPLDAARAGLHHGQDIRFRRAGAHATAIVLSNCAATGRSYWEWTATDWADLCGGSAEAFVAAQPLPTETTVRPFVIALGYLLGGFDAFEQLGTGCTWPGLSSVPILSRSPCARPARSWSNGATAACSAASTDYVGSSAKRC